VEGFVEHGILRGIFVTTQILEYQALLSLLENKPWEDLDEGQDRAYMVPQVQVLYLSRGGQRSEGACTRYLSHHQPDRFWQANINYVMKWMAVLPNFFCLWIGIGGGVLISLFFLFFCLLVFW
jgi:hypothetical protein